MIKLLTQREREIAHLLMEGLGNSQIAEASGISINTVKTHLKHIYIKLEVKTRQQVIIRLYEAKDSEAPTGSEAR